MIINKRITSGNINLLRFLFPNYNYITELPEVIDKQTIFNGDITLVDAFVQMCQKRNCNYIVNAFYSDIDLTNRRILANIVFEKWRNATLPKYLDNIIDSIQYNDFIEAIKIKWVSGKWTIHNINDENSFLDIIENLNKSKLSFIKIFFNCLKDSRAYIIESSMITFLQKAKDKNYIGNSFQYKKKLEMYKDEKFENTLRAIDDSFEYNIDNPELRLLNILMNIQDNDRHI